VSTNLLLLPAPRSLIASGGTFSLPENALIVLDSAQPQELMFAAARLQQALLEDAEVQWEIIAGTAVPSDQVGITLSVVPGGTRHPQGYELLVDATGIRVVSSSPVGVFYAILTLIQIVAQEGRRLPTLRISDWPDFPQRGIMLDISRDKVPTMETLFDLVDLVASWKINQFQLYTEHTFAYRRHPEVWATASPLTGEEILALDAYCRERFIELVPNQNSFGHMRRWLIHDRYRHLAECPHGCDTCWGHFDEPFSLCPEDPDSLELLRGIYDELLPHFSSHQVNVGCDETVDLGQGRSKAAVEERGKGRVYLSFLLAIYRDLKSRGYRMQFWGDIIMLHPELVGELPRDVIALEWGYEADHPFDSHGAILAASGVPFYVCPGTSSWNSVAGRTANVLENLRNAAENGLKHGAVGYLITDWGDNGHWQPLPVSYLGFACGSAVSWAYEANREQDMAQLIGVHVFHDSAGIMGGIACDLGNVYQVTGLSLFNETSLFRILQDDPFKIKTYQGQGLSEDGLRQALDRIDQSMSRLSEVKMQRTDADLILREYDWVADMLRHACRRGIWVLGQRDGPEDIAMRRELTLDADRLMSGYEEIWMARNRPGGFVDTRGRMLKLRRDYDLR